jgi:purine-binding chemotaxis protein CheW
MMQRLSASGRAEQLRQEFDLSFTRPTLAADEGREMLLAIRFTTTAAALRLGDISALVANKAITPVPAASGALLGLAAFRGAILPVFDLQNLVLHARSVASRFLVVAASAPLAFAFEGFEGQVAAASSNIVARHGEGHAFANDLVTAGTQVRPIIHLPSVIEAIRGDDHRAS